MTFPIDKLYTATGPIVFEDSPCFCNKIRLCRLEDRLHTGILVPRVVKNIPSVASPFDCSLTHQEASFITTDRCDLTHKFRCISGESLLQALHSEFIEHLLTLEVRHAVDSLRADLINDIAVELYKAGDYRDKIAVYVDFGPQKFILISSPEDFTFYYSKHLDPASDSNYLGKLVETTHKCFLIQYNYIDISTRF